MAFVSGMVLSEDGFQPIQNTIRAIYGVDFGQYISYRKGKFQSNSIIPSQGGVIDISQLGSRRVHIDIMKGRRFKVLFINPNTKKKEWKMGSVVAFKEYSNGPCDEAIKLTLNAIMDEYHECYDHVIDRHPDDKSTSFNVVRLNVNGGGTVQEDDGNFGQLLSLEWIDPLSLDDKHSYYFDPIYKRPEGMDRPIDQEKLRSLRNDMLKKFDTPDYKNKLKVDKGSWPEEFFIDYTKTKFLSYLSEEQKVDEVVNNDYDIPDDTIYNIRMDCLSMPFISSVSFFIKLLTKKATIDIIQSSRWLFRFVQIYVECASILRDDLQWIEQSTPLVPHRKEDNNDESRRLIIQKDRCNTMYHQFIIRCGEYYEDQMQFRAAIWAYKQGLAPLSDPEYVILDVREDDDTYRYMHGLSCNDFCNLTDLTYPGDVDALSRKDVCRLTILSFIGLDYKKADDLKSAFLYYSECLSMTTKRNDDQDFLIRVENHKSFKSEAKEWVGSTGKLTPLNNSNESDTNDEDEDYSDYGVCYVVPGGKNASSNNKDSSSSCFACKKKATALSSCSGCSALTWYCSRDCQRKAWPRHKLICFNR